MFSTENRCVCSALKVKSFLLIPTHKEKGDLARLWEDS